MARNFTAASSQYLTYAGAVGGTYPFTMACWFMPTNITSSYALMGVATSGATDHHHRMIAAGAVAGDPVQAISRTTSNASAASTAGYSANVWNHACGVFSAADSRTVYLNGGNSATETTSMTPAGMNETNVGRISSTLTAYFNGDVAEIGIWGVALSAADVASLATGASPLMVRPESLLGYWPLIGRTSPEIELIGAQGFTLGNTPVVSVHPRMYYPRRSQGIFVPAAAAARRNLMLLGAGA